MDCPNCEEQFSAVLEGSDSALTLASREHLEVCPACRVRYESFRHAVQHLRALPPVRPPRALRASIAAALDAEYGSRRRPAAYWQPLTAGLSVAACLVMVVWAVVLNPMNTVVPGAGSRYAAGETALVAPAGAAGSPAFSEPAGPPAAPDRPARAGERGFARRGMPNVPGRVAARPGGDPLPTDLGGWGTRLASAAPAAETLPAGSGKPAGTFAADSTAEPPLQKTSGELQLAFTPPAERSVGTLAVGQLLVTSQAEANITIRVKPATGLRILNARDGILYAGAIRRGDKLQLPVRMIARQPGKQRLHLTVEADVAGVATELPIIVPEFTGEAPQGAALDNVNLVFHDTPSLRAIRELAAAAGAEVVIAEGLEPQLVTQDFSAGVPFRVALSVLCENCGYRLEERNGVFHVLK